LRLSSILGACQDFPLLASPGCASRHHIKVPVLSLKLFYTTFAGLLYIQYHGICAPPPFLRPLSLSLSSSRHRRSAPSTRLKDLLHTTYPLSAFEANTALNKLHPEWDTVRSCSEGCNTLEPHPRTAKCGHPASNLCSRPLSPSSLALLLVLLLLLLLFS